MKKLTKDKWKEVFYGDYVDHIEVNETKPEIRKNSRYVSVEHMYPLHQPLVFLQNLALHLCRYG